MSLKSLSVDVTNPIYSSVTTPIVYGGNTASSTLTLQSTSGTGTSDSIIFKTGSGTTAMTINTSQNVLTYAYMSAAGPGAAAISGPGLSTTVPVAFVAGGGGTYTDTVSSGTVADAEMVTFRPTTVAATNVVTYTNLSTLRISGSPVNGTNVSIANAYALYVASGTTYLAGYTFTKQVMSTVAVTSIGTGTTATLTAAQLLSGYITGAPTNTATYTLPAASAINTELAPGLTNSAWEFTLATTTAFSITIATATGWTLVGSMATGAVANSVARFRCVKNSATTATIYRIS
jgi:hypothetical protein